MAKLKRINPVAKFAQQLQRCAAFRDRKKQAKQGYAKHKKREVFDFPLSFCPRSVARSEKMPLAPLVGLIG
jgi:hypothetical protein